MRFIKPILLIQILFSLVFLSCSMEQTVNEPKTIFIPVFESLSVEKSRAISMSGDHGSDEVEFPGMTFLPQLRYFSEKTSFDITSETFPIQIFGETIYGELVFDPEGERYTITYNIGEDEGRIIISIDSDGSFSYKQYLLIDTNPELGVIMFLVNEIANGQISKEEGRNGEFVASGQIYYGSLEENENGTLTSFSPYSIGRATSYVRGTESMVYGIVDSGMLLNDGINASEELVFADKNNSDITISDLLEKLHIFKEFDYERSTTDPYPMNDFYYSISEGKYYGQLSYGNIPVDNFPDVDTREKLNFHVYTASSFENLGYPDSANLFEFLGDSLGLEYELIGEGNPENWIIADKFTYIPVAITETGTYMVPSGFNFLDSNLDPITYEGSLNDWGGALLELQVDTEYYIAYSPVVLSPEKMINYCYLYKLE